jgi:16S rRNA (guanine(966)-N(2))-methyltransferase RsmD
MKILSGSLKGRNIICPAAIRPVSLMVRKACFDILGSEIKGSHILDLFAGSGSLGLEALSRGAGRVIFVDNNSDCITVIEKNIISLDLSQKAQFYLKDALRMVEDAFLVKKRFNFIFLDPPYHLGLARKALQTLEEYDILTPSGYILVFCYLKDVFVEKSNHFELISQRKYGQTLLLIYRKENI